MAVAHLKLPLTFDVERLHADLARIGPEEWTPHFNTSYYDGLWSGVALRTTEGAHVPLYPDPSKSTYVDLPVLGRCPYIAEVLGAFHCPLQLVRLLKLDPGSNIKEHSDFNLSYEDGEVRVHIPIQTNPAVEFVVDGSPLPLGEGECWYINFNLPHRIHNRGNTARIHLVLDCVLNDWLRAMFPPE
jgi:quercetin dioxygenase-like cupin family protein